MKNKVLCTYCGVVRDNDVHNPHTTSECDKTIAVRQMMALESIAESFARMIKEEYSDEEYVSPRIVGDGTGPDPMWAKPRKG